ncbi:MAG: NAD(P)H-hydrate dehydratase [Armatimonadota bacterium]|nr:NAD(P)H-hydrate dehydratase [Armatimonadota bacterium]
MRVATAAEIREIDRRAEEEYGLPGPVLMEQAGRRAAEVVRREVPAARRCVVLAGKGRNGGDGLVASRHLAAAGWRVEVLLAAREEELGPDIRQTLIRARAAGVEVMPVTSPALAGAEALLSTADVILDALFGTGFRGTLVGIAARLVEAANAAPAPIVALDIPSGVDADTGAVRGPAITARTTVTMGLPKVGLLLYPGAGRAGRVVVADIGYPRPLLEDPGLRTLVVTPTMVAAHLPARPPDAHKGTFGRVVVVAGSVGFTGAPSLCALGALRVGVGLVTLAVPEPIYPIVAAREVEAMPSPLPGNDGAVGEGAWERVRELAAGAEVIAAGPGLSRRPAVARLVRAMVTESPLPLVLDADALNVLAEDPDALARGRASTVVTPHPGEMSRLLGLPTARIQEDRLAVAREAARRLRSVVVLKGARTVVAGPDGEAYLVPTGNPGMATGGMGDVLTGVIAGLMAQGMAPLAAAWAGAYLHGLAGDLVAKRLGQAGLLTREVADALPLARRAVLEGRPGPLEVLQ